MGEKINGSSGGKQSVSDFMQKYKVGAFFQKYTMIIALVVVTIVFATWKGKEGMIKQMINPIILNKAIIIKNYVL